MKTFLKLSLLAAGLTAASLPLLADATTSAPAPAAPAAGKIHARHPRLQRMMQRQKMAMRQIGRRLDLSADQVAKLKASRATTRTALQALKADTTLTPEQKRAKAREILQAARTEARSTLTPEQQKRAHRMRDRMQAMRQHRRKL